MEIGTDSLSLRDIAVFCVLVAVFVLIGEAAGWRAVGITGLWSAVKIIREKRFGVAIEGRPPRWWITGVPAVVLGGVLLLFAIALILSPEATMMRAEQKPAVGVPPAN